MEGISPKFLPSRKAASSSIQRQGDALCQLHPHLQQANQTNRSEESGSSSLGSNLFVASFLWPALALFSRKYNSASLFVGVLCVLVSVALAMSPEETVQVEVTYPDEFEFSSITVRAMSGSVTIQNQPEPLRVRKLNVDLCEGGLR